MLSIINKEALDQMLEFLHGQTPSDEQLTTLAKNASAQFQFNITPAQIQEAINDLREQASATGTPVEALMMTAVEHYHQGHVNE